MKCILGNLSNTKPLKVPSQMGHRKELRNIAGGMIRSFTSRNNDVDGYWEIGKLYGLCKVQNTETVKLDLLNSDIEPKSIEFIPLVRMWKSKLESHLKSRKIPLTWVSSADIVAKFDQEYIEEFHLWGAELGDHCTCTCEISSDNGRVYFATSGTNCKPHNPEKEKRSTRRNDV